MYFGLHWQADNNAAKAVAACINFVKCLSPVSQCCEGPAVVNSTSQKVLYSTYTVGELIVVEELCVYLELHWLADNNAANVEPVGMDFVKCLSTVSQCVEGPDTINSSSQEAL